MFLSGSLIIDLVKKKEVSITPFLASCVKPASYTLHLDSSFRRWKKSDSPIKLWSSSSSSELMDDSFECKSVVLAPGEFILASTLEYISIPDRFAGTVSPLSHIARFGLSIHCGADWVNPGFGVGNPTKLTLELKNNNNRPLELNSKMPIAHLRFSTIGGDLFLSQKKKSIYEGKCPLILPKFHEEWSKESTMTSSENFNKTNDINWPPFCCVPAFLYSALTKLGVKYTEPTSLPGTLDVFVGPEDPNPLSLNITDNESLRGISVTDATVKINKFLDSIGSGLIFRHVPFKSITFGLYKEVLLEALAKGLVVGIGVDYSTLKKTEGAILKHVFYIEKLDNDKLTLYDTSGELGHAEIVFSFSDIEEATLSVLDGYWIIGDPINFPISYT